MHLSQAFALRSDTRAAQSQFARLRSLRFCTVVRRVHLGRSMREHGRSHLALVPLWMMVVAFVLPTYSACESVESPATFAAGGPTAAAWVTPPFLFALVFSILTVYALSHRRVSLGARRLALAALAAFAASTLGGGALFWFDNSVEWVWLAGAGGSVAAAAVMLRTARGQATWLIWERLIGAFALLALGSGPTLFLGDALIRGQTDSLHPGAYVYLGSVACLLALTVASLTRPVTERYATSRPYPAATH
jgi:hypothetical protein